MPLKGLERAGVALRALYRLATGVAFAVLIVAVLVQVIGRAIGASPVWTEELARFALLYLAALGVGLAYRSGDLVNVDVVAEALPGRLPWALRLFAALATAALCIALVAPAWLYTTIGARQTSPALGWRMDLVHASVLVLLVSLALFALARVVAMLAGLSDGRPALASEAGASARAPGSTAGADAGGTGGADGADDTRRDDGPARDRP